MKLIVARFVYFIKGLFEDPEQLFANLGVDIEDRILEIGCAIGYHTLPLARIASEGKVYAVDIWEDGLSHIENKAASLDNVELLCRSADEVRFPPSSLDKVICFDTLHEVPDPGKALQNWAVSLKADGKLLYRDPTLPAGKVEALSKGQFRSVEKSKGVDIFTLVREKRSVHWEFV